MRIRASLADFSCISLNQTVLYTMAGLENEVAGQSTVQGYVVKDQVWQSISVAGGSFNQYDRYMSMHASSFEGGGSQSFISGGQDYLDGMIIFNSSDPFEPSWKNVSNSDIPYFWGGATQYVRFGEAGVLVSFGGFITETTSQGVAQRREMNSIQVYDIAGEEWFTVFATGDIPSPRSRICSALSAAPDDSSFQMILYGGWDEENALGDVYILTMPAFVWIKVNTTSGDKSSLPRMDHFCTTYKDRQMLVIGGRDELNADTTNTACGDGYPAIRLLDTTTFTWQTQYPLDDDKYQVPQAVIDVVGGGPDGGANKSASSFSKTLGNHVALFSKTIPRYDPDNPPSQAAASSPGQTSTSNTSPSASVIPDSQSSLSSGAIAGIVVGSVVGVGLLAAAVWFSLIQRIRRRRQQDQINQSMYEGYQMKTSPEAAESADESATKVGVERRFHEIGASDPAEAPTDYRHELSGEGAMRTH